MGWYEALKDAVLIAKKAGNIELQGKLLDLQQEMQDMQQENSNLKADNEKLLAMINKDRNMKYDYEEHVFYEYAEDETKEGPYCPTCWQKDKLAVHLQPWSLDLKCSICGKVVGDKNQHLAKQALSNLGY